MSDPLNASIRVLRELAGPWGRARNQIFFRRYERRPCALVGVMEVVDIGADYAGVILEVSQGGCSFRPASLYMLDRTGETVVIRCEYFVAEGRIRATRSESYGVQFVGELDAESVARLLASYGGPIEESELARRA